MNEPLLQRARPGIGALCLVFAWLYPFFDVMSRDALQQMCQLAMFSTAALLFGLRRIPPVMSGSVLFGVLLVLCSPSPYWGRILQGVAGVLLLGLACHVGARLRQKPAALVWVLFGVVAAAFANAAQGLLQWSDLVGELFRWMAVPEQRGIAFGIFRQRNLFASFLCVGAICTVWLVQMRRISEPMAWVILLVMMFAVAASGSRTGTLEVVVLAVLALVWRKLHAPAVTRLMLGQLALLALGLVVLPMVANFLGFEFASSASRTSHVAQDGRLSIWGDAVALIAERPWLGWGWRETGYAQYMTLVDNRYNGLFENVHNLPLQLALEFGLPAALILGALFLRGVYLGKPWAHRPVGLSGPEPLLPTFAWAILVVIVGIHSMLEYPLWYAGFLFLTGVSMGYLSSPTSSTDDLPKGQSSRHLLWHAHASAVGLLVLAGIGWQQFDTLRTSFKIPFTNDLAVVRFAVATALSKASGAWLFQEQLDSARLSQIEIKHENASQIRQLSEKLLHASAEPRVIQPLLWSLWYLHDLNALQFHAQRFCAAFPDVYARWYKAPIMQDMAKAAAIAPQTCKPQASAP